MTDHEVSATDIEAFVVKMNKWGRTLPSSEQALFQHLINQALGGLDDSELEEVSGGASGRRHKVDGASLKAFLPRLSVGSDDLPGGGAWMQWAQRTE